MRHDRPLGRRPVGLTSLIDVIFLLLLFFMLATSFSRYQAMPVGAGQEGGGAQTRPALLRLHDAERLDLNGVPVTPEALPVLLGELRSGETRVVAIRSEAGAQVQDLVFAIAAVRASQLAPVVLAGDR
jgi:biopolymer transport protein ExbD